MGQNNKTTIKYFGFGTNKDLDMMAHITGNTKLKGEPGRLLGYEVCIIKSQNMRTQIPKNSPVKIPPRDIIIKGWGPDFDMFVSRANPNAEIHGTIWDLTPQELELVKEWELVDYGLQDEVWGKAIDSKENIIEVETQALTKPTDKIDRVVTDKNYNPYVAPKDKMLQTADKSRLEYLARISQKTA